IDKVNLAGGALRQVEDDATVGLRKGISQGSLRAGPATRVVETGYGIDLPWQQRRILERVPPIPLVAAAWKGARCRKTAGAGSGTRRRVIRVVRDVHGVQTRADLAAEIGRASG